MILAIRTDSPEAHIACLDNAGDISTQKTWPAGRQLADQLLEEIKILAKGDWSALTGLIVFAGPGSFTGLRIGITVANTVAHSQKCPIVGVTGDSWLADGAKLLREGQNQKVVLPHYGAEPNISKPK